MDTSVGFSTYIVSREPDISPDGVSVLLQLVKE